MKTHHRELLDLALGVGLFEFSVRRGDHREREPIQSRRWLDDVRNEEALEQPLAPLRHLSICLRRRLLPVALRRRSLLNLLLLDERAALLVASISQRRDFTSSSKTSMRLAAVLLMLRRSKSPRAAMPSSSSVPNGNLNRMSTQARA